MPIIKTILLYQYDELPTEKARSRAREWFSSVTEVNYEPVIEDFKKVCECVGMKLDENPSYSISYGPNDQVSFVGAWHPNTEAVAKIRWEFPKDEKLLRLARLVEDLAVEYHEETCKVNSDGSLSLSDDIDQNGLEMYEEAIDLLNKWLLKSLQDNYYSQKFGEEGKEYIEEQLRANSYTFRDDGKQEDV